MHVYPDLYTDLITRAVSHLQLDDLLALYTKCRYDVTRLKDVQMEQESQLMVQVRDDRTYLEIVFHI